MSLNKPHSDSGSVCLGLSSGLNCTLKTHSQVTVAMGFSNITPHLFMEIFPARDANASPYVFRLNALSGLPDMVHYVNHLFTFSVVLYYSMQVSHLFPHSDSWLLGTLCNCPSYEILAQLYLAILQLMCI